MVKNKNSNTCYLKLSAHSSSEKTTSYRRTSSGGGSQGKCVPLSPSCVGSQEELYCSLVGNNPGFTPAPAPAQSSSPALSCAPRTRRNAMVRSRRNLFQLHEVCVCPGSLYSQYKFAGGQLKKKICMSSPGFWQQATSETCQGFSGLQSSQFRAACLFQR